MLTAEAMMLGLAKRDIQIARINYQENGNWAFLKDEEPFFHLHLYGRTINSKIQKWGEALYFPDPSSDYYNKTIPLNNEDIYEIVKQIEILETSEKYNLENWM